MIRIYEIKTESKNGKPYGTYRLAAKNFEDVLKKFQRENIAPYKHLNIDEQVAEVKILASES